MLYASFVRPEGVYNSLFNKFAAFATKGQFCHSEFIFRWSDEELKQVLSRVKGFASLRNRKGPIDVAVYIVWGDIVRYRVLSGYSQFWSVPEQDMIPIQTSWENELNTITWLSDQLGRPYDKVGALLSPFAWRAPQHCLRPLLLLTTHGMRAAKTTHDTPMQPWKSHAQFFVPSFTRCLSTPRFLLKLP